MITAGDAARILGKISAYDQRTVGEADVAAWREALNLADPAINLGDALDAIARWHAEALDGRMRPAHVIQGAQAIARRRLGAERRAQLDERLAIEAADQAKPIDRTPEVIELVERFAAKKGTGDPRVLRRREWVEHEERRQREQRIGPNPNYNPARAAELARRQDPA